jgi:hypothetical protein
MNAHSARTRPRRVVRKRATEPRRGVWSKSLVVVRDPPRFRRLHCTLHRVDLHSSHSPHYCQRCRVRPGRSCPPASKTDSALFIRRLFAHYLDRPPQPRPRTRLRPSPDSATDARCAFALLTLSYKDTVPSASATTTALERPRQAGWTAARTWTGPTAYLYVRPTYLVLPD